MLVILTVESSLSNFLHGVKMMFDPVFSDSLLLLLSPIHLLIEQTPEGKLYMLSLVCIAGKLFFSWEKCM
ncbi:unnamed protein product [Staurois parvus]|uniref:Uncharacterized protein n=1 Tax=Staurois parvus TaxID=386267 RepID=A0ABN9H5C3_9NEOB|nr:unnamed protein product [Staurois parvus]